MKVLITGATGFIGGHLVHKMVADGYQCRCLVRKNSNLANLADIIDKIELFEGDIQDKQTLNGIGKDVEAVIHLAAHGHVAAVTDESYKMFNDINIKGTQNLIESCLTNTSIIKFIHFSSTAAMGLIKDVPVNEDSKPQPRTPYQKSKRESEIMALSYFETRQFPVIVLRPCMVYGPGGEGEFLKISRLIKKGIFPKVGFGKNLTPAVYVDDVVQAAILAVEKGMPGSTYIIASETSFELDRIRELVLKELGINRFYPFLPKGIAVLGAGVIEFFSKIMKKEPIVTRQNIRSTFTDRVFDISRAKEELGYKQQIGLEKSIKNTIAWFKAENLI